MTLDERIQEARDELRRPPDEAEFEFLPAEYRSCLDDEDENPHTGEKTMDDNSALIRQYVELHAQLMGVAHQLYPAAIMHNAVNVFAVDGKHYQLLPKALPLDYEIPVIVRPVRVIGESTT